MQLWIVIGQLICKDNQWEALESGCTCSFFVLSVSYFTRTAERVTGCSEALGGKACGAVARGPVIHRIHVKLSFL